MWIVAVVSITQSGVGGVVPLRVPPPNLLFVFKRIEFCCIFFGWKGRDYPPSFREVLLGQKLSGFNGCGVRQGDTCGKQKQYKNAKQSLFLPPLYLNSLQCTLDLRGGCQG